MIRVTAVLCNDRVRPARQSRGRKRGGSRRARWRKRRAAQRIGAILERDGAGWNEGGADGTYGGGKYDRDTVGGGIGRRRKGEGNAALIHRLGQCRRAGRKG